MHFGGIPPKSCMRSCVCHPDRIKILKVFHGLLGKKLAKRPNFSTHEERIDGDKIVVHVPRLPSKGTKSEKNGIEISPCLIVR